MSDVFFRTFARGLQSGSSEIDWRGSVFGLARVSSGYFKGCSMNLADADDGRGNRGFGLIAISLMRENRQGPPARTGSGSGN